MLFKVTVDKVIKDFRKASVALNQISKSNKARATALTKEAQALEAEADRATNISNRIYNLIS